MNVEQEKKLDSRPGYWASHEYKRHSVDRDIQLTGFIGWRTFSDILDAAQVERNRKLILSAFKIGGRINEVLGCCHEHFRIAESPDDGTEYLLADAIPLSKRWKKIGEVQLPGGHKKFLTQHIEAFRTFALPLEDKIEPFSEEFASFVLDKTRSGLLFPSPYKRLKGKSLSTTRAYQIVRFDVGERAAAGLAGKLYLYNHLLRAWRASQLRKERKFEPYDLMEFFMWRDYKTAFIYAKEGVWGLAGKGLKQI